ncbi:MAG: GIY-YIG nuclease family protein, partial [Gelidibacter sp.]
VPYRLTLKGSENSEPVSFYFRPELTISKKTYKLHGLDREAILSAPPFSDIADELIEIFQNNQLTFSELKQFQLLQSQFRSIGYNFNVRPKTLFYKTGVEPSNAIKIYLQDHGIFDEHSIKYANAFVELMHHYTSGIADLKKARTPTSSTSKNFDLSQYQMAPGVYYFLNALEEVIYVGKAKNIRKRLQSHFSNQTSANAIDYNNVERITVEYSGNDILAQLIESANIKALQPMYNTQQVTDPAPYLIIRGKTANGIHKLQIVRKPVLDAMPEQYFNRLSVKQALENFCIDYDLCRKHCGLEKVKGSCSKVTVQLRDCVCSGEESNDSYNKRFDIAFYNFKNRKNRKIYKVKGRHKHEDAFIYLVNGIYEGYGFIDKNETISNVNDLLGHLKRQTNNYDTSRIVSGLDKTIAADQVLILDGI